MGGWTDGESTGRAARIAQRARRARPETVGRATSSLVRLPHPRLGVGAAARRHSLTAPNMEILDAAEGLFMLLSVAAHDGAIL